MPKISRRKFIAISGGITTTALAGIGISSYLLKKLNNISEFPASSIKNLKDGITNSLFKKYPALYDKLPWVSLGEYPTPINKIKLPASYSCKNLYVKCDNLSSTIYGGNKVRKLEFLLAEALLKNKKSIVTLGGIGSNHALATSLFGEKLGFQVDLSLYDQPLSNHVLENVYGFQAAGAKITYSDDLTGAFTNARTMYKKREKNDELPYFIINGGSCRLGNLGYLNAAFELAEQIELGQLPEPDVIYVAVGTCGTASGLIAGLKMLGLKSKVIGVKILDSFPATKKVLRYYAQDIADYLHKIDSNIPKVKISFEDFSFLIHYLGDGYAIPTEASKQAVKLVSPNMILETTYTGKTLAACLDYCKNNNKAVLFWNTFNSAFFSKQKNFIGLPNILIKRLQEYPGA